MDDANTSLHLLQIVIEYSKQVRFSRKRCAALGSRCITLRNIIESHGQDIMDQRNAERLNGYLSSAGSIMATFSSRNSLASIISSYIEELDEIIMGLDLLIQEMNLQVSIELRDTLRRLELRYKAEKSEDDKEMPILLAENNRRLEDIKDFLSLADVHPFLQRIMEIITEPGQMDINKVINIVKRIERSEDDDSKLADIKDIIREGRAKGHDDHTVSKDIINIVSDMVQAKNKLEPADPRISPRDLVVGRVLGSGAFGTIHEGTWQSKTVAVKVIKDLSAGGNKAFEREIRAINTLKDCSNIVSLFGYCVDGNSHMIVMELAQNGSLFDFIHYNSTYYDLSDVQKHNLIVGITHGVAVMHQVGIVHRDLKSPNVLLDSRMMPKITDFGLAGMGTKSLMSTLSKSTALSIGSVYWKAPEILAGKKHTKNSDIFSLGIITWEVLQGEMPFNGEEHAIVSKLITDGKKMQVSSGVDSLYKKIVNECQNMNSEKRPTAAEILQWLRNPAKSDKDYIETQLIAAGSHLAPQKQRDVSEKAFQESQLIAEAPKLSPKVYLVIIFIFLVRFIFMILSALYFDSNGWRVRESFMPADTIAAIVAGAATVIWIGVATLSFRFCCRKSDNSKIRALAFMDIDAPRILDQSLKAHRVLRLVNIVLVDLFQLLLCSISMGVSRISYWNGSSSSRSYYSVGPAWCLGFTSCTILFAALVILIVINLSLLIFHIYNLYKDSHTANSERI